VEQATAAIAQIGALAAAGKIGLDEANDLVGHQKAFIEARVGTEIENHLAAIENALRSHDTPASGVEASETTEREIDVAVRG
jgi:hypothetical protein